MNKTIPATLLCCLVAVSTKVSAEDVNGSIAMVRNRPIIVRSVLPADCRVVRGFTHGPVDGRDDTRYSNGVVGEWAGLTGSPGINYRVFNGNNGLHLTLPSGGFDALQVRGDWIGKVYLNSESLLEPDVKPLCEIPLRSTGCSKFTHEAARSMQLEITGFRTVC